MFWKLNVLPAWLLLIPAFLPVSLLAFLLSVCLLFSFLSSFFVNNLVQRIFIGIRQIRHRECCVCDGQCTGRIAPRRCVPRGGHFQQHERRSCCYRGGINLLCKYVHYSWNQSSHYWEMIYKTWKERKLKPVFRLGFGWTSVNSYSAWFICERYWNSNT